MVDSLSTRSHKTAYQPNYMKESDYFSGEKKAGVAWIQYNEFSQRA